MKRWSLCVLAVMLSAALLIGCSSSPKSPETSGQPSGSQSTENRKTDEPITIHFVKPGVSNDSPENARIKAKIEEEFFKSTGIKVNIDLKYYDWDVIAEKFNLDITSGKAPDMIRLPLNLYFQFWQKGYFQPLNELIDAHVPNLAKRFSQEEIDIATINGQIAGFPLGGMPVNSILIIRQDKLDALGKSMPTTLEELEDVMAAYKQAHPNEYPFMAYWSAGLQYMNALAGLEAYNGSQKILKAGGTVTTYYMHEDMARYLELANRWYKNGWVTPDFMTAGEEVEGQFIKDQGLTVVSYQDLGLEFIKQTQESVNPNARAGVVPQLKAPWGEETIYFDGYNKEGYIGIPKNVSKEKAEIVAKLINWELENPDNFWLTRRGEKGIDYEIVDGKMKTPDKWLEPDAKPYNWEYWMINSAPIQGGDLNIVDASALPGAEEVYEQIRTAKTRKNPLLTTPNIPLDELAAKFDSVTKKLGELQSEIIVGRRPLSDWDQSSNIWKNGGGEELEKKMTDVYNSLKQ